MTEPTIRNGTLEEINRAIEAEDATWLPYNAYFVSLYGDTYGMDVRRYASSLDSESSVMFISSCGLYSDFHNVNDVAVVGEEVSPNDMD